MNNVVLSTNQHKALLYIIDNYGNFSREKLKAATLRIQKRLGGLDTTNVINHIERGEIEKAFITLLRYYDRWYEKGIDNRPIDKIESILFNEIKPGEIAESCAARLVVAGI